tara:strand:+ start:26016 stop:26396 length:381 start_codon:yes stop_codon:yes gene_type:complete
MRRITIHNPSNLDVGPISATFPGDSYRSLKPSEEVQLVDTADQELMFAEVLNVWEGPLAHTPAMLLEMSHDPLQRTFAGVHMHLVARRAKQEDVIDQETVVSILVLRPKQSTLIRPTLNQIKGMVK